MLPRTLAVEIIAKLLWKADAWPKPDWDKANAYDKRVFRDKASRHIAVAEIEQANARNRPFRDRR